MTLTLLDWRRRVGGLYAAARTARDPETAWQSWRDGRDELFADHPDSPFDDAARAAFRGLPFSPYDPALRFEVSLDAAEPLRLDHRLLLLPGIVRLLFAIADQIFP